MLIRCFACKTIAMRLETDEAACEMLGILGWRTFVFKQLYRSSYNLHQVCPKCANKIAKNFRNVDWLNKPWVNKETFKPDLLENQIQVKNDQVLMSEIKSLTLDEMLKRIHMLARFYKGEDKNAN